MKNKLRNLKLGLAGIVLAGSLNNLYGQNANLDSLLEQNNIQRKSRDSLFNKQMREINRLNEMISPERFSKMVYSENLSTNLDDKKYYVTKKNEEDGIRDLIKICDGYEESFLYLPEKQIWYEIGIHSGSESAEIYRPRIKKALEENKDAKKLIIYHNHPGEITGQLSRIDMHTLCSHNLDFSDYKIVGKIITKNYITEYSLNSKGKEKLKDPDFGRYIEDFTPEYFDIKCTSIDGLLKK